MTSLIADTIARQNQESIDPRALPTKHKASHQTDLSRTWIAQARAPSLIFLTVVAQHGGSVRRPSEN